MAFSQSNIVNEIILPSFQVENIKFKRFFFIFFYFDKLKKPNKMLWPQRAFIFIAFLCQLNLSTAFLFDMFNNLFGYGIQPSLYQPLPPNNLSALQQAQQWQTRGIYGAFDNAPRGIGGCILGLASLVNSWVTQFTAVFFHNYPWTFRTNDRQYDFSIRRCNSSSR